jgi:hypothetical protein
MEEYIMEQDKVNRLSEVGRKVWDEDVERKSTSQNKQKVSFGQWWAKARPTKTVVFWSWLGFIILTMIVGFNWGGWVTGGTAREMAKKMANDAVIQRVVPICVAQFNQDPGKEQKLKELQEMGSYERGSYVEKQGWATMAGEAKPDRQIANECAKLLTVVSP